MAREEASNPTGQGPVKPDERIVLKIPPELWDKVREKTGTDGKVEAITALVNNGGNGSSIEIPESIRNMDPEVLREMIQRGSKEQQQRQFWNDVLLEAKARKARADAVKAELEIQNLKVENKNYSYRDKPLWCWQHEDFEGVDSKCFAGYSEADKLISQHKAEAVRERQSRKY